MKSIIQNWQIMNNRLTTMQEFELITVVDNKETIKQQFDFYATMI